MKKKKASKKRDVLLEILNNSSRIEDRIKTKILLLKSALQMVDLINSDFFTEELCKAGYKLNLDELERMYAEFL